MKRIVDTCVLVGILVLALVAPAGAGTLDSLFAPAECATEVPEFHWLTGGNCGPAICRYEEQCWDQCPEAESVACVNGFCEYTLPGGGSGGGGGNNCQQSLCSMDYQCTCNDGTLRQCINNLCVP
jgi:hypothetical protein